MDGLDHAAPIDALRHLQRRVRELVGDDGDKIASFLAELFNDESAKMGDRLEAAKILLEQGWGKAPIAVDTDGTPAKFVLVSAFAISAEGPTSDAREGCAAVRAHTVGGGLVAGRAVREASVLSLSDVTLGSEYNPRIIELLALAPHSTTRLASALKVDDGGLTEHLFSGLLNDGLIRVCGADGSTPI